MSMTPSSSNGTSGGPGGPSDATVIEVRAETPYDVVVGRGVLDRLPSMIGGATRVAVVISEALEAFADHVVDALGEIDVVVLGVPAGEDAKSVEVALACWDVLGEEGFTRSDVVVTLGGGATTDVGGYIAAGWLRGVRVVHVPTTLLGMVDAAVGGKTGVNTAAGKNLVGAFHEPAGVLCELGFLETLPREELVAGMAEVLKCGLIADGEILRLVEESAADDLTTVSPVLRELIERAVRVKAEVVSADLRETAGESAGAGHPGREALNYGHTLGHAIERAEDYEVRHGEAVAVGCVFAAELGHRAGGLSQESVDRHRALFGRVGLPVTYTGRAFEDVAALMAVDKKARGHQLRFVVLDEIGAPRTLAGPSEQHLREAYAAVGGGV